MELEVWPVVVFIISVGLCLLGSTVFHLFGCSSPWVYRTLRRVDMSTVGLNTFGCLFPICYYMFYCEGWRLVIYGCFQSISLLVLQMCSSQDWFYKSENTRLRSNIFLITSLAIGLPCLHGLWTSLYSSKDNNWIPFGKFGNNHFLSIASFVIGVQFYKYKVPERWRPGKFDIWVVVGLTLDEQPHYLASLCSPRDVLRVCDCSRCLPIETS